MIRSRDDVTEGSWQVRIIQPGRKTGPTSFTVPRQTAFVGGFAPLSGIISAKRASGWYSSTLGTSGLKKHASSRIANLVGGWLEAVASAVNAEWAETKEVNAYPQPGGSGGSGLVSVAVHN
jgi:hypothetical protein